MKETRRQLGRGAPAVIAAVLALLFTASAGAGAGATGVSALVARAAPGDTIVVPDGKHPALVIQGKRSIVVEGTRAAVVGGIVVDGSTDVTVRGLTIAPTEARRADIRLLGTSSGIVLERVLIDGRDERLGAGLLTEETVSNLTIRDSEITNCGWGERCVDPKARNTLIERTAFHDCLDCDFIRGGGNGITIRKSTFDRAMPGACAGGAKSCPHNDHIQITGGGPWTLVGNRFGERRGGAASVFVNPGRNNTSNPIHDVTIASNVFAGGEGNYGIHIGDNKGKALDLMHDIAIVNNTVLQGAIVSIRVNGGWTAAEPERRPIVANNVLSRMKDGICAVARVSRNVVESGAGCPSDFVGRAALDITGAPTLASSLVVNRGDPLYAPKTDFFGRYRRGLPDIGAIELGGLVEQPTPLSLSARSPLVLRTAALKARGWKLSVRVQLAGAARLQARLLQRGRSLTSRTLPVTGKRLVTLTVALPPAARKPGRLLLALRATAEDSRWLARTLVVTLRA